MNDIQKAVSKDLADSYNEFKEFEGKKYTGMKVGGHHKWHYAEGVWKEKKVAPDKWQFEYAVKKSRAGKAPEGSGVPTGTGYHWYIIAHQHVTKQDANNYSTAMTGLKYKVAHKRADKETWSASDTAQRRRIIKILQDLVAQLEQEMPPAKQPARRKERKGVIELRRRAASDEGTRRAA